jgi:UDP:flavonoid glycosyltransferase YjiC (YdhE family)
MTAGSRGDVAPFTGLGHELARAGHEVTLVTHESFAALVGRAGLGFHGLPVDPRAELLTEHGRRLLRSRSGPAKLARLLTMARRVMRRMAHGMLEVARESDVLLLSASVAPLGRVVADGLGLPSRGVYLQPIAPTGVFPPSVLGARPWGPAGNRVAGRLVGAALDAAFAESARMLRGELGVARDRAGGRRRARGRPFWASRLTALGVSPGAVPLRQLTGPEVLADALTAAVGRPEYRLRAAEVAAKLRQEDATTPVLAALERYERGAGGTPG